MEREMQIAWAAGFLDGEAWLGVRGARAGRAALPRIEVAQNVREPLDRLRELFGGHVYPRRRTPTERSTRRESWFWKLDGAAAVREVVPLLLPYLTVKREAARALLVAADAVAVRPRRKVPD